MLWPRCVFPISNHGQSFPRERCRDFLSRHSMGPPYSLSRYSVLSSWPLTRLWIIYLFAKNILFLRLHQIKTSKREGPSLLCSPQRPQHLTWCSSHNRPLTSNLMKNMCVKIHLQKEREKNPGEQNLSALPCLNILELS